MIRSDRIKARMEERGISQGELARRVGVTQGAIAKIANRYPNGSSYLHKIARELSTTAEYLLGETDEPNDSMPQIEPISSTARDLLRAFESLSPTSQSALLTVALAMAGEAASGRVQAKHNEYRPQPRDN